MNDQPDRFAQAPQRRSLPRALVPLVHIVTGLALALAFMAAVGVLALHVMVLPNIDRYRAQLVERLEAALEQTVDIERLEAGWERGRPRLQAFGIRVGAGDENMPALTLDRVDAIVGWTSLLHLEPYFERLELVAARVHAVRQRDGRVFVAGQEMAPDGGRGELGDWLFRQREIVLDDARLVWDDRTRVAPLLELDAIDVRLLRLGGRYRFELGVTPPEALAARVNVRGDLLAHQPTAPRDWLGQIFVDVENLDVALMQQWLSVPHLYTGTLTVRAWMNVDQGREGRLYANLRGEHLLVDANGPAGVLTLNRLGGRLEAQVSAQSYAFSFDSLDVEDGAGQRLDFGELGLEMHGLRDQRVTRVGFNATRIELASLTRFAPHFALPDDVQHWLSTLEPQGRFSALRFGWEGRNGDEASWDVETRFEGLSMRHHGRVPGLDGFHGRIAGDMDEGLFEIEGEGAMLDFPAVFPESRLELAIMHARGGWAREGGRYRVHIDDAEFRNADAAGSMSGSYWPEKGSRGKIDLQGELTRADARAVWRYLPWVVNPRVREWLRTSLIEAESAEATVRLAGALDDFPFDEGAEGVFRVDVDVRDGVLHYDPEWPPITGIHGRLRFDRAGMFVEGAQGRIFDVVLDDVDVALPDMATQGVRLKIEGGAHGETADFLRYVRESRLYDALEFVGNIEAETGNGALTLALDMPLSSPGDTRVEGAYRFSDNRVRLLTGLPALESARGEVAFSEDSVTIDAAYAEAFDQPLELNAHTDADGVMRFAVQGAASMEAVRRHYADVPVLEHVTGTTPWQADIVVGEGPTRVVVESALEGVASALPAPLTKPAADAWPLHVAVVMRDGEQHIEARLHDGLAGELVGRQVENGPWRVLRGGVGLNHEVVSADAGVMVSARLEQIDVDAWREALGGELGGKLEGLAEDGPASLFAGLDVAVDDVQVAGQSVRDVELGALRMDDSWSGRVHSSMASGAFEWRPAAGGALVLRLDELDLAAADLTDDELAQTLDTDALRDLPAMDVVARRFRLRDMDLGRLELRAHNAAEVWQIDHVALITAESRLQGSGRWRAGSEARTELELELHTDDLARLLKRLGQPEAVDAEAARLGGEISWRGVPTRLNVAALQGELTLDVGKGRFRQLEPGVGRLLGVLSLQSLPRRLQLDFSDVFAEGFAFDTISGSIDLDGGVARTHDLSIAGPAARVWLEGSADLSRETQDLLVLVQPTLSESIAIGAAAGLINPVAGVVAYLAQKALRDPVEKMFAFGYAITGTWSDPQVKRLDDAPQDASRSTPLSQEMNE